MSLERCPACGGGDQAYACIMCNGQGVVSDGGPPRDCEKLPTERYNVSGHNTERVIVKWLDGTEHTLYRPPRED